MKTLTDCYTLSNGVSIPCIGFGTWKAENGEVAYSSVRAAVRAGYRHIDTAAAYGNEESIGRAIADCGVDRSELFITTKLWNSHHGYDLAHQAFSESLSKLGLDYIDLYLIHWPNPKAFRDSWQQANAGAWRAMEELLKDGRARAIGVSNFRVSHLKALEETQNISPMVNQIFLCPGETQTEVTDYMLTKNMLAEAYSPLGSGSVFDVPEMKALAKKYGKSVAQICIRWSLQMGYLPLPKSVNEGRIFENADVFGFEISDADMALIATFDGICGVAPNPDDRPF